MQEQGREAKAAVRHLAEDRAIALGRVDGNDEGRVAAKAHEAALVALGEREVDNARIRRVGRVHGVVRHTVDALERTGRAELGAIGEGHTRRDLEPNECHGSASRGQVFNCESSIGK